MMEGVKIIVVGASIAGIAAARQLRANGFRDVAMLEAEDRFGGRILTTKFGKKKHKIFVQL